MVWRKLTPERNKYSKLFGRYAHFYAPETSPEVRPDDSGEGAAGGGDGVESGSPESGGETAGIPILAEGVQEPRMGL